MTLNEQAIVEGQKGRAKHLSKGCCWDESIAETTVCCVSEPLDLQDAFKCFLPDFHNLIRTLPTLILLLESHFIRPTVAMFVLEADFTKLPPPVLL